MIRINSITLPKTLRGTIHLPLSKSISARVLVIGTLAENSELGTLSDCDDTRVLCQALSTRPSVIDVQAAGTAMRFSTAFFAVTPGTHVITGTARMRQRPIRVLVDALRRLGADISYEAEEGFPPLRVSGSLLSGGEVTVPANVSSQYISALMMVAPVMTDGLLLHLSGQVASAPYINMTMSMMRAFGARVRWDDDGHAVRVEPGGYAGGVRFEVEPDWSAASYWYEMMALTSDESARLVLPGLQRESVQGDGIVWKLFEPLGVQTTFAADGIVLSKTPSRITGTRPAEIDFTACPDLAQTLAVTCAMLRVPFVFTGLQSLRIKETDRIAALKVELAKLGCSVEAGTDYIRSRSGYGVGSDLHPLIATYDDHRMAMSFAPCAYVLPGLRIADPAVVCKSYPDFWKDLERIGATIDDGIAES